MGGTILLIPFGPGEVEALDAVKEVADRHRHRLKIQPSAGVWAIAITDPEATDSELADTYAPVRRLLDRGRPG